MWRAHLPKAPCGERGVSPYHILGLGLLYFYFYFYRTVSPTHRTLAWEMGAPQKRRGVEGWGEGEVDEEVLTVRSICLNAGSVSQSASQCQFSLGMLFRCSLLLAVALACARSLRTFHPSTSQTSSPPPPVSSPPSSHLRLL